MAPRRFETPIARLGAAGLNLTSALDARTPEDAARVTNLSDEFVGSLVVRAGLTSLATASGVHHTVRRFHDPSGGTYTRVWGVGSALYLGQSGAVTLIESGYSGDPLTIVPTRFPGTDDDWVIIADRGKSARKLRFDGTVGELGIAPPADPVEASLDSLLTLGVAAFDGSDGTDAGTWTGTAGVDRDGNASDPPTVSDQTGVSGNAVRFETVPGGVLSGYSSIWGRALTKDLSVISGRPTTSADYFHLWMKINDPNIVQEVRIYLVVDTFFDATVIPGTSESVNQNAYVRAFRGSDIEGFVSQRVSSLRNTRTTPLNDTSLFIEWTRDQATRDTEDRLDFDSWVTKNYPNFRNTPEFASAQLSAGVDVWTEFGITTTAQAFRFSNWNRLGTDESRDWSNVTGIIVFVQTTALEAVAVSFDDFYIAGGYELDGTSPGTVSYDWRYVDVDPRTGEVGNPSPIMDEGDFLAAARQSVTLSPTANGDAAIRQWFYRRGGLLGEDWFFLGENSADGADFVDTLGDTEIQNAGTLEQDNDQPVTSIDASGDAILNAVIPAIFGPVQGLTFAVGDLHRPGTLYWSKVDRPGSWPAANAYDVAPPSEELLHGCVWDERPYCFSRVQVYAISPHLGSDGQVEVIPTSCHLGPCSRWAWTVSRYGIVFVSATAPGVYLTSGGPPLRVSDEVQPLFEGRTVEGYAPIDWSAASDIRLTVWQDRLFLHYKHTGGTYATLVLTLWKKERGWRIYQSGVSLAHYTCDQDVESPSLIVGGRSGASYLFDSTAMTDAGTAITWEVRTGSLDVGRPREDKLWGDVIVDATRAGETLVVATYLNHEVTSNATISIVSGSGREQTIQDPFGTSPQEARALAIGIGGTASAGKPIVYQVGASMLLQPDKTIQRATDWDDCDEPTEKLFTTLILEVNTFGLAKSVILEATRGGVGPSTAATIAVTATGRHRLTFSGLSFTADLVRLRPTDANPWEIFSIKWIYQAQPPKVVTWDTFESTYWDTYYTGVDLDCDTGGETKLVDVYVDGVIVADDVPVVADGRRVVHITIPAGRGHVYRFVSTDANPGSLFGWRWFLAQEPSEQHNWNQNFTIAGTLADKTVHGVILDCDTFDLDKEIALQVEGETQAAPWRFMVNTGSERKVVNLSFPGIRGRLLRLVPLDTVPGRLYHTQWIYDEEPYALERWETRETDHGVGRFFIPIEAWVAIRIVGSSPQFFTLSMNLWRPDGSFVSESYRFEVVQQAGGKTIVRVPFRARKCVLINYAIVPSLPTPSTTQFFLYREETHVLIQPWSGGRTIRVQPFGTDGQSERDSPKRHQAGSSAEDAHVGTVEGKPELVKERGQAPPSF